MSGLWIILAALLVLVYLVSPIDALPDVFPIFGRLDDLFLAGLLIYYLKYRRLPWFVVQLKNLLFGSRKPAGNTRTEGRSKTASKDPYEILGLKPGASSEEIHNAYREAVKRYHPDRVSHLGEEFKELAAEKFVEIQRAYDFLVGKSS